MAQSFDRIGRIFPAFLFELFIQRDGNVRFGSIGKTGAPALQICVQRKLGNNEKISAGSFQIQIHFAVFVFKNAASADFICQTDGFRFSIFRGNTQKNQESLLNASNRLSFDYDGGFRYPCYNSSHNSCSLI